MVRIIKRSKEATKPAVRVIKKKKPEAVDPDKRASALRNQITKWVGKLHSTKVRDVDGIAKCKEKLREKREELSTITGE